MHIVHTLADGVHSVTPKYPAGDPPGMTEDHDEDESEYYDPTSPTPPARVPPRRSTAPQSEFTSGQVGFGFLILAVGLVVTFGLPFLLG